MATQARYDAPTQKIRKRISSIDGEPWEMMIMNKETPHYRFQTQAGTLYLCPTPLGNLGDMTLRGLEVLQQADIIYAEDTRRSLKLLSHFEIHKPLYSYHEHNRKEKEPFILKELQEGKVLALVTDAGMPGISDPGTHLVQACLREEIPFEVLPGPSAMLTALVASGLSTHRFVFEGFLPRDKRQRKLALEKMAEDPRTLIFYEAPHRIKQTLRAMVEVWGPRRASLGRELTKKHEEWFRLSLPQLLETLEGFSSDLKGEMVLVVEGADEKKMAQEAMNQWNHLTLDQHVEQLILEGKDKKTAIKEVAVLRGLPKREVYQAVHLDS